MRSRKTPLCKFSVYFIFFFQFYRGHPYQDPNPKFDNKGFWTYDACAVQFNGESYLIGGAYDCSDNQDSQYCGHLNVQRAVMKLSKDSCGLDIVMDGMSQK